MINDILLVLLGAACASAACISFYSHRYMVLLDQMNEVLDKALEVVKTNSQCLEANNHNLEQLKKFFMDVVHKHQQQQKEQEHETRDKSASHSTPG